MSLKVTFKFKINLRASDVSILPNNKSQTQIAEKSQKKKFVSLIYPLETIKNWLRGILKKLWEKLSQ